MTINGLPTYWICSHTFFMLDKNVYVVCNKEALLITLYNAHKPKNKIQFIPKYFCGATVAQLIIIYANHIKFTSNYKKTVFNLLNPVQSLQHKKFKYTCQLILTIQKLCWKYEKQKVIFQFSLVKTRWIQISTYKTIMDPIIKIDAVHHT